MRRKRRSIATLAALLMLAATAIAAIGSGLASAAPPNDLQAVKAATARYHSIQQALADGYVAPPPGACIVHPALPGLAMGYHFENPALMEDNVIDPLRPEMLLYERKPNGRFRLIGVEYYIEADQTTSAPVLFGQTFQGPMPAHHPFMETHYDLHVWLWKHNPLGLFATWNPDVNCP